jgi:glycerol-3-phosphate dehydrogenase
MERKDILQDIQSQPEVDVLIIGGGVNGIGTFRDLALQGVRVLLAEKDDFCSGASAASSHMLHGGIRYLENGEFRLVKEALHERNLMLKNAPHYSKPLPTTIPIFRRFSGLLNAPLKFLGLMSRPAERGALVIKLGLMMYDAFTGSQQTMPFHTFRGKKSTLDKYPQMNPEVQYSATYYDAWMPIPERICIEMIMDAEKSNPNAMAVNYMKAVDGTTETVVLVDEQTGQSYAVKPKVVINAGGPWIDFINAKIKKETKFIGGTKGSHLILENPELRKAIGETEIFFENSDGRIVLILPYQERVMLGTTDIRIDNPEEAVCTDDEIEYILSMVPKVFPNIHLDPSQIVFQFSGVRPLPASADARTGTISRDHSIKTLLPSKENNYPIHSLIGGKWTSFRAFSEQTTDVALKDLEQTRQSSTTNIPIGGGKNYPADKSDQKLWIEKLQKSVELPIERLQDLFDRYGTYAADVAKYCSAGHDTPLATLPAYSKRELEFLAQNEKVERLSDMLLRRTLISTLGYTQTTPDSLNEVGQVVGQALGWSEDRITSEIQQTKNLLVEKHGLQPA